jgi:hypothetical protein
MQCTGFLQFEFSTALPITFFAKPLNASLHGPAKTVAAALSTLRAFKTSIMAIEIIVKYK